MPSPKPKTSIWLWPALALVVGGGVFAAVEATGSSTGASSSSGYEQRPQDVTITTCAVRDGRLDGAIKVTNRTSAESTYAVQVTFDSPDGRTQYDIGTTIIDDLAPGAISAVSPVPVTKKIGDLPVHCAVAAAARYTS